MRAITTRIRRLETALAPQEDLKLQHLADLLRERRRRRLEASGEPFEEVPPPAIPPGQGSVRRLSLAETLRLRRQRWYERNAAAAARQPK